MRMFVPSALALTGIVTFGSIAAAQVRVQETVTHTVVIGTGMTAAAPFVPRPNLPPKNAVIVVGKVIEVEAEPVQVAPFKGAPPERMLKYKVATLQIEDRVVGAGGITRVRVGFLSESPPTFAATATRTVVVGATTAGYSPSGIVTLNTGTEGLFNLAKHPNADFYVIVGYPTAKKDANFAKEVDRLKRMSLAMNDPVAALKQKSLDDRFEAAQVILQRYLIPQGSTERELIPEEENKLLLALLAELPWAPPDGRRIKPDGRAVPCRSTLWYSINPNEFGFKRPVPPKRQPGDPPADFDKLMDEASTAFLKENADKIRLKRFVQK